MKIAIASGKGGTGKTTISVNLASMIAQKLNREVTLVDLDVEEPNSGLFLSTNFIEEKDVTVMVPKWDAELCDHCGVCNNICAFNALVGLKKSVLIFPELCHNCNLCSDFCPQDALPMLPKKIGKVTKFKKDNLTFIEGRLNIGIEQAVPLIKATKRYAENLKINPTRDEKRGEKNNINKEKQDRLIIFDAPPGTSHPVMESVAGMDLILLVSEPSPFGLNDLILAVETMKTLKKKVAVIINRATEEFTKIKEYCEEENIDLITEIKDDKELAKLYSSGSLIYDKIDKELSDIYQYIIER